MQTPDNIQVIQALRDLGHFASTHTPHSIGSPSLEPVAEDADDFNAFLMQLARKVDAVIEKMGEYLQSHGILSKADVEDCFRLQLESALEGNATFLIVSGIDDRLTDTFESDKADHDYRLAHEAAE